MPPSPMPAKPNLEGTIPYPPCPFTTPEEKKLYNRLRDVYTKHYRSWDAEACNAWPVVVEHASLTPSTIGKITNHSITRHMVNHGVTWAHVIAIRVIYKEKLFKSRKIMRLVREKYPRANFHSFAYNEEYKLPIKIEYKGEEQEPAVPNHQKADNNAHKSQREGDPLLTKAPLINDPEASRGVNGFLNEENCSEAEETEWPYSTKKKSLLAQVKNGGEEGQRRGGLKQHAVLPDPNTNQPIVESSSKRQKRAISKAMQNEGEAESDNRDRKRNCTLCHAASDNSRASPRPNEAPDSSEEALHGFTAILEKLLSAVTENTKAAKENTERMKNILRGK